MNTNNYNNDETIFDNQNLQDEYELDNAQPNAPDKKDARVAGAVGAAAGIAAGAGGAYAAGVLTGNNAQPTDETKDEEGYNEACETDGCIVLPLDTFSVPLSGGAFDHLSFGEAFAAARAELGAGGVFAWRGNYFNTYLREEWQGMSPAERSEFVAQTPTSSTETEPIVAQTEPLTPTEPEVSIAELLNEKLETINDIGGSYVQMTIDGQDALIIDVSGNGSADLIVKAIGNGIITENLTNAKLIDLTGNGTADIIARDVSWTGIQMGDADALENMMIQAFVRDVFSCWDNDVAALTNQTANWIDCIDNGNLWCMPMPAVQLANGTTCPEWLCVGDDCFIDINSNDFFAELCHFVAFDPHHDAFLTTDTFDDVMPLPVVDSVDLVVDNSPMPDFVNDADVSEFTA